MLYLIEVIIQGAWKEDSISNFAYPQEVVAVEAAGGFL